jgi:hypothetical protein
VSSEDPFFVLFDPVVEMPPRGEQEVKDEAFEFTKELAIMSDIELGSSKFFEAYQRVEGVMLTAEPYRAHLFLLSLHTVRHMLATEMIHLAHPDGSASREEQEKCAREALRSSAEAIVEMLTQILFMHDNKMPVLKFDAMKDMPDFIRLVMFDFEREEG